MSPRLPLPQGPRLSSKGLELGGRPPRQVAAPIWGGKWPIPMTVVRRPPKPRWGVPPQAPRPHGCWARRRRSSSCGSGRSEGSGSRSSRGSSSSGGRCRHRARWVAGRRRSVLPDAAHHCRGCWSVARPGVPGSGQSPWPPCHLCSLGPPRWAAGAGWALRGRTPQAEAATPRKRKPLPAAAPGRAEGERGGC